AGKVWGEAVTEKLVWHVVKEFAAKIGVSKLAPHDLRRYAESRTMGESSRKCSFGVEFATNLIIEFGIVRGYSETLQKRQQVVIG
ncbi:MAG TPA: hypothetical protein VM715_13705, partial [Candidatus Acidoferrum sp.]|nr:hypothetical protein [Candidatus Acidoferrum sp.]